MTGTITRRALLRGLAQAAAFGALAVPFSGCGEPRRLQAFEALLGTLAAGRELGEAYLRSVPAEGAAERLSSQLLALYPGDIAQATREDLERFFARQIRADFEAGRVAVVQRWTLSLTEARLFACAALSAAAAEAEG